MSQIYRILTTLISLITALQVLAVNNGRIAEYGEYPEVYYMKEQGCTAVAVSPKYLLTAAHCFSTGASKEIKLEEHGIAIDVTIHPKFNENRKNSYNATYDIAVVEFFPKTFTKYLRIQKDKIWTDDKVNFVGFGEPNTGIKYIGTNSYKGKYWNQEKYCAKDCIILISTSSSESSVNKGDSGGPLIFNNKLIGISGQRRSIDGGTLNVFTDLRSRIIRKFLKKFGIK